MDGLAAYSLRQSDVPLRNHNNLGYFIAGQVGFYLTQQHSLGRLVLFYFHGNAPDHKVGPQTAG